MFVACYVNVAAVGNKTSWGLNGQGAVAQKGIIIADGLYVNAGRCETNTDSWLFPRLSDRIGRGTDQ